MKVFNEQTDKELTSELKMLLADFRSRRNFDPKLYCQAKAIILNDYMTKFGLKSCVVAVSGGIDSAVVLGLVKQASLMKDSPITRVIAVCLPVLNSTGVTNQEAATSRGEEVAKAFGITPLTINLSNPYSALKKEVEGQLNIQGQDWAIGQLVPYLRTPTLYYITSLLSQEGAAGIICGTTNKDEGAYLGYFGKASDGMVDIQLISDLHKSEVFAVGACLNVPDSVILAKPTGDMFDNRVDEEVFGASYDFVELYLNYLELQSEESRSEFKKKLGKDAQAQFNELAKRLENLHDYNKHKYLGASPAVHLDLYQSSIEGGWITNCSKKVEKKQAPSSESKIVGAFALDQEVLKTITSGNQKAKLEQLVGYDESFLNIRELFSKEESRLLLLNTLDRTWVPVGQDGIKNNFNIAKDPIGSYRVSAFCQELAQTIWKRIEPNFQKLRVMKDNTPTEWNGSKVWTAKGVSPLFRFIRYKKGGLLVPHYDAPFEYDNDTRTLMSLVIYLTPTSDPGSGQTRLIKDPQEQKELKDRVYKDWNRVAQASDVLINLFSKVGDAVAFDHRILHDSETINQDEDKIIIRTDIIFKKCGL